MTYIEFLQPYDSSDPGLDGVSVTFPIRISEEPASQGEEHAITVSISGTLMSMWGFDRASRTAGPDLTRTLFAFARREVDRRLTEGSLAEHHKVALRTDTAPKQNPFDPERIPDPHGFTYTLDRSLPSSVEATVGEDGTITIRGLPFQPGERVDIVVRPRERTRDVRPPERAPVIRFDDPFGSVAEDDWEAPK